MDKGWERVAPRGWLVPFLLGASALHAQAPPDAGRILREQAPPPLAPPATSPQFTTPQEQRPAAPAVRDDVRVTVREVRLSGDRELVDDALLGSAIGGLLNRELRQSELFEIAERITEVLRERGYLIARAFLPPQDITAGVLEVAIVGGRLGSPAQAGWQLQVQPGVRSSQERLRALAEDAIATGAYVEQPGLERGLVLLAEQPGIGVQGRLAPGASPGTTLSIVDVRPTPVVNPRLFADNAGSSSTGAARAGGSLLIDDALGLGERFLLLVQGSRGTRVALFSADAPLAANGLRAQASITSLRYDVKRGPGVAAGLEGKATQASLGLTYPWLRLDRSGDVGIAYERKALQDDSAAGTLRDRTVNLLALRGAMRWQDAALGTAAFSSLGIEFNHGRLNLGRVPGDAAADAAGLRTVGDFSKLVLDAGREQGLGRGFSAVGRLRAQWASKNLDSSEEFSLGGPTGVRGYPVGEASGDQAWLLNTELRWQLPMLPALQLVGMADAGGVRINKNPGAVPIASATGKNSYTLKSAGLGVRYSDSAGRAGAQLSWSRAIGSNEGRSLAGRDADGRSSRNRIWAQVFVNF